MDPAVVARDVGVYAREIALDGIPEIVGEDADHRAGEEEDDAALVVQLEVPTVNVDLVELEVLGDVAHDVRHLSGKVGGGLYLPTYVVRGMYDIGYGLLYKYEHII